MTTKSQRNRSARRNRQMIEVVDHARLAEQDNAAWEQLKRDGRTVVSDYGTASQFKLDHDDFGRTAGNVCYIRKVKGGWEVRVVHEDPAEQPHLSPVLAAVAEAEEWGVSVDDRTDRRDSRKRDNFFTNYARRNS